MVLLRGHSFPGCPVILILMRTRDGRVCLVVFDGFSALTDCHVTVAFGLCRAKEPTDSLCKSLQMCTLSGLVLRPSVDGPTELSLPLPLAPDQ